MLPERTGTLTPENAKAHSYLGLTLQETERLQEAVDCYRTAIDLDPDYAIAHNNLGSVLQDLGKWEEAVASCRKAIAINPDYAEAHNNLGHLQLMSGDYENGWNGYDWRWRVEESVSSYRELDKPLWQGEPIDGKKLLVWPEQGVGDEIFCAGMMAGLLERGAEIILLSDDRLAPLFSRSFPTITCLGQNDPAVEALEREIDVHIPIAGLGRLFHQQRENIADPAPYLAADARQSALFRKRYQEQAPGLLVGIAWTSVSLAYDKPIRMKLSDIRPILEVPGITFVDCQYGDSEPERLAFAEETGIQIFHDDDVDQLVDIDALAAQLAALDLVIGIDNSLTLLSGAMGIPTWNMLRNVANWCWGLDKESIVWAPSTRLFRQQQRGEWASVTERVARELSRKTAGES